MQGNLKLLLILPFILFLISCERIDPEGPRSESSVYIPDSEFLFELIGDKIDTNGDSIISYREAEEVTFLNLSNYFGPDITDLTGIEAFINLEILVCRCNKVADLDLSKNTVLQEVYAYDNDLKNIDVSGCKDLTLLHVGCDGLCHKNRLTKLDISNNQKLRILDCRNNLLTKIDVSNNHYLESLYCPLNQITELDLSNNIHLNQLEAWSNQLTSLDVSNCESLTVLDFSVNQITEIALENNPSLVELDASRNFISSLNLSNNPTLKLLIIKDMPMLKWICINSFPFPPADMNIISSDNSDFQFITDCSIK